MSTRFGFVDEGWVVRLVEAPAPRPGDEVVAQLVANDSASIDWAAAQLNRCDVAIMQGSSPS
jgi:hypothetical protein